MKKKLFLACMLILHILPVNPCTTFVLSTKTGLYFGKNLDWISDLGMIMVNRRNMEKRSVVFAPEKPASWKSRFGSITFNQFGKEFPFGGINEKGLVVEILVSDAEYALPDERPVVNELQWIQYQLDNCETVEDVIATDRLIRVGQTTQNLHYLVCDRTGNSAVIEFIDHKIVAYRNKNIAVLENDLYKESLSKYNSRESCRYKTATDMLKAYREDGNGDPVTYAFSILDKVIINGSWSIVYNITGKKISFRTETHPGIRSISLDAFDFSCEGPELMFDMQQKISGAVEDDFEQWNAAKNSAYIRKAAELNDVGLNEQQLGLFIDYVQDCTCP